MAWTLLSFYTVMFLSAAVGYRPAPVAETTVLAVIALLPFVLDGEYSRDWLLTEVRRVLRFVVFASFIAAILIPSMVFRVGDVGGREVFGVPRFDGIAGHPNAMAIFALMLVLLEVHSGRRFWIVAGAAALVLSQSTTAWVAALICLSLMRTPLTRVFRFLLAAVAVAVAAISIIDWPTVGKLIPSTWSTATGRTTIWEAALQGFYLNPTFGYGPSFLDLEYRTRYLGEFDAAAQAHNQFIQTLGQNGLIGLSALLALYVIGARRALTMATASSGLSLALMALLLVRSMTETPLRVGGVEPTLLLLILVFGYLAAPLRPDRSWASTSYTVSSFTESSDGSEGRSVPPRRRPLHARLNAFNFPPQVRKQLWSR